MRDCTRSPASQVKASTPQTSNSFSYTLAQPWGWRRPRAVPGGGGGPRHSSPEAQVAEAPHLTHCPGPTPRTPAKRWAHGGTERPVAWGIRGLPRSLRGAPRNPRLLPPGAALPGRGRDALEAAGLREDCGAQREKVRLRREPRPRWMSSRDTGGGLGCERAAVRL